MLFVLISVVGNAKKGKKDSKRFLLERPFKMILNLVESKRYSQEHILLYISQYKFTLYNLIKTLFSIFRWNFAYTLQKYFRRTIYREIAHARCGKGLEMQSHIVESTEFYCHDFFRKNSVKSTFY